MCFHQIAYLWANIFIFYEMFKIKGKTRFVLQSLKLNLVKITKNCLKVNRMS